jgi:membrane-bound inhibitor of C-type lysozyme
VTRTFCIAVLATLAVLAAPAYSATATSTTFSVTPSNNVLLGQPVTVAVSVTAGSGTPTGSVTLFKGFDVVKSGPLSNGSATLSNVLLPLGTKPLSVVYTPNTGGFAGSTSTQAASDVTTVAGAGFGLAAVPRVAANNGQVVYADFNNDGIMDIAYIDGNGNINVLLGRGDGTFSTATGSPFGSANAVYIAAADFNGDGDTDLAVTSDNTISVYLGNGQGRFGDGNGNFGVPAYTVVVDTDNSDGFGHNPIVSLLVADLNGDGIPDLITSFNQVVPLICGLICSNGTVTRVAVAFGDGTGNFGNLSYSTLAGGLANEVDNPQGLALADFNGDGKLDVLISATPQGQTPVLYMALGSGNGSFNRGTQIATVGVTSSFVAADFNGDGFPDVAYNDGSANVQVLLNDTTGNFNAAAPSYATSGGNLGPMATADFNGDGKLDLVMVAGKDTTFLLGNGNGTFGTPTVVAKPCGVNSDPVNVVTADFGSMAGTDQHREGFFATCNGTQPYAVALGRVPTTTTLSAAPTQALLDQSVALTAAVAPASATGKVTFYSGTTILGTATLGNGTATLTTNSLPTSTTVAGLSLLARYEGDASNGISTGSAAVPVSAVPGKGFAAAPGVGNINSASVVVQADFNLDGIQDLAVSDGNGRVTILLGNGTGGFTAQQQQLNVPSQSLAVGDVNGDGIPDLIAMGPAGDIRVFLGNGSGGFTQLGQPLNVPGFITNTMTVGLADFNLDGIPDIVVVGNANVDSTVAGVAHIFLGNGDGTFAATPLESVVATPGNALGTNPAAVVIGDFNGDGIPDLVVLARVANGEDLFLLTGRGDGTFTTSNALLAQGPPAGNLLAAGDFGSGRVDVAYFDTNKNIRVALNNGSGGFTYSSPTVFGNNAGGITTGDFNGAGKLGLGITIPPRNAVAVLFGTSTPGTFTAAPTVSVCGNPRWIVVGNYNGDNRSDFVVACGAGQPNVQAFLGQGFLISSLMPASTVAGAGVSKPFTLTINATNSNFSNGDVVNWLPSGTTTATQFTSPVVAPNGSSLSITISGPPYSALLANQSTSAAIAVSDPSVPNLVSNSLIFNIVAAPSISGITPSGAAVGGTGAAITISGTNFASGDTVSFQPPGGAPVTGIATNFTNGTLTATLPQAALGGPGITAGTGNITVVDGSSGVPSQPFPFNLLPAPALTNLNPPAVGAGSPGISLTISGNGFVAGDTVNWTANSATTPIGNPQVVGSNQITVTIPAGLLTAPGTSTISVVDPDGALSNSLTFTIAPPSITALSPASVGTGAGNFALTVNGSNFIPGTTVGPNYTGSVVLFTDSTGAQHTLIPTSSTAIQLQVTVPGAFIGNIVSNLAQVAVQNPGQGPGNSGGPVSGAVALPIGAPTIISVNPAAATTLPTGSASPAITVNGTNFAASSVLVWCNACSGSPTVLPLQNAGQLPTPTQLVASILTSNPNLLAATGTAQIWVGNNPGNLTDPNTNSAPVSFPIASLVISSISPTSVLAGGPSFTLTIIGQNQNFAGQAQVLFGSGLAPIAPGSAGGTVTSNSITVTVPASYIATPGVLSIQVQNPNGATSPAVNLPIQQIAISNITPTPLVAGSPALTLDITGQSFSQSTAIVWTSGITSTTLTSTYVSSGEITATATQALLAQAGAAQVTAVTNIQGVNISSPAFSLTVNAPVISGLNPSSSVVNGNAFALQVNGSNFLNGSTVRWTDGTGQTTSLITSFVSSNQLTALVQSNLVASAGTALVTVQNPAPAGATGAISAGELFAIGPTPTINTANGLSVCPGGSNCSPATSATAGSSQFLLEVSGTNYQSGSVVVWTVSGTAMNLTTGFVDDHDLQATVPSSLLSTVGAALITVQNPGNAISNGVIFNVSPGATPTLTALLPANGVTVGGTAFQLTASGSGFANGAQVNWINGSTTTGLATVFQDANTLNAVVPANLITTVGTVFVDVVSEGATSSSLPFSINPVPAVTITSLNQSSATAGTVGFTLGVNGTGFNSTSVVQWSAGAGPQALPTIFVGPTEVTALIPASQLASAGTAFINVVNTGGTLSNSVAFTITPASSPSINVNGLSPASATAGSAAFQLTITGQNFVAGSQVQWNSGTSPQTLPTIFVNSSQLTVVVPASLVATPGTAFVDVLNTGGLSSGLTTFSITAAASSQPSIASPGGLSPSSATAGGSAFQISVTGTNFVAGAKLQWDSGSGPTGLNTSVLSATQLSAVVPANLIATAGTAFLSVLNPGNATSNVVVFTINAAAGPSILSAGGLSPASAVAGSAGFQLSVTGSNFVSGATVQWAAGGTPQSLTTAFVSSSQLTALVPAPLIAAAGNVFVSVQNPGNIVSNLVAFSITAVPGPMIAATGGVTPSSAAVGSAAVSLSVSGANFVLGSMVQWSAGGTPVLLTTGFVSSTQLTALIPANLLALPATALITVVNPGGSVSNAVSFGVTGSAAPPSPTLTSIAPVSAPAGSASLQLTIAGQNFVAGSGSTTGSVVQWNGSPLTTTFVSASQLTAQVSSSLLQTPGTDFVVVVNGNSSSSGATFQVNGPTATTLAPASVAAGAAAFSLVVTGTNFVSGSTVVWSGANLTTTFNSSTQLTALISSTLVASAGSAFVLVTNPGGSATLPLIFSINVPPAPVISGLNPPSAVAGGPAFQLTVTGTGFVGGSTVMWNGSPLATGFMSATQITALIDASLIANPGVANVTVQNPGAPLSAASKLNVNGPTITSLTPATANAGDPAFSLTVAGTNFVPGSAVQWNGTALPTAYSSSTQIQAAVPASYVASAGTASVAVQNPGGAVSAFQSFTIGQPSLSISTSSLPDAVVGTFYSQTLAAQGGNQPYTWTISAGNLPAGLILSPTSGTISGTPTGAASVVLGVTVSDSQGRTAVKSLQLQVDLLLSITTLANLPTATAGTAYSVVLAATGGSAPYLWSAAGGLPPGLSLNVATGEISGAPSTPGGYHFTVTVTDSRQQQTASRSFTAVVSISSLTIGGLGSTVGPAQQVPLAVTIPAPFNMDLSGSLTVSFTSAAGGDDPSIQFSTGGRTVSYTIPAGTTTAIYPQNAQLLLSTGTVAGTITVQATLQVGASDITPAPAPQAATTVPKQVPVITSVTLKKTSTGGGVTVTIAGYSTTKELVQATLQFNAAAGSSLNAAPIVAPLSTVIAAWYQSAAAAGFGSQISVSIPISVSGDISAIGSVTVTLTNTQGNSATATAQLQ